MVGNSSIIYGTNKRHENCVLFGRLPNKHMRLGNWNHKTRSDCITCVPKHLKIIECIPKLDVNTYQYGPLFVRNCIDKCKGHIEIPGTLFRRDYRLDRSNTVIGNNARKEISDLMKIHIVTTRLKKWIHVDSDEHDDDAAILRREIKNGRR